MSVGCEANNCSYIFTVADKNIKLIRDKNFYHDGLIIMGTQHFVNHEINQAIKHSIPYIVIHPVIRNFENYVDIDDAAGATKAVNYLFKKGRKKIACLASPLKDAHLYCRYAAWQNILTNKGFECYDYFAECASDIESAKLAISDLIEKIPDIDAVFCATDLRAIGVVEYLKSIGKSIPQDVAVIGMDNIPYLKEICPELTTIHLPRQEMGKQAVIMLRNLAFGSNEHNMIIDPKLIERETV
jgi:DNA-binding LacI/PurR family transcriptional regulator